MIKLSSSVAVKRMAAVLAAMLMLVVLAGCSANKQSEVPRGGAEAPVAAPELVRGTLPGVQVVSAAKLAKADQQTVATWVANGRPLASQPTLAADSYTPEIDGHVLVAERQVGNSNGIATSMISLQLDPEGTKLLTDLTTAEAGKQIVVVVGGKVADVPEVQAPITTGQISIEGDREFIDALSKQIVPATP